ncbi:hypothetical protein B5X24_HaOG202574 [Helicoverpa armigera]|uniref:C2H2-type domain-containing protein n=1 Tax=Helicoverpa armigera TaxID=29058 RepID=A0A2W1C1Y7_HELAM|nr:hypothetical protein B5X24_HaOG202574 [Helicoverpa armigera]
MNRADSQIPSAPTHLYLLQMDPSINLSSNEQGLPLHILDNSLDFGHKQYLLPLPNKQKEGQDLQVLVVHISDRVVPPRALAVLPPVLQLQRRHIISTRRTLPARARFGPVQGIRCKISYSEAVDLVLNATSNKKPLFLVKDKNDTDVITHIDTSDKDKSNWIGLLPLGDESTANVWLYEENYELYGITTETLPARKPLMLGYSKHYADSYGLIGPTKDIDKGSRCDNDFNPYTLGYKDENGLTNYLDFSCKIENNSKEKLSSPEKPALTSCPYCNQSIVTSKRRQHMSKCPARVLKCECKKVFTSRKLFTEHIWAQHSNANAEKNDTDSKNPAEDINQDSKADVKSQDLEPSKYKCEDCQLSFKRRGMLVNHLWRVHNMVSAKVPLERSVRTYPCGNCPKIYRTAAKRDRHVQQHHPGAAKGRGQALESGTRVCEPAMCSACPRQYATRAKLLQHQRAQHPYMVPPSNRNTTKTK